MAAVVATATPDQLSSVLAAKKGKVITPSDTDQLATVARGIYIGGAGNLEVVMVNDTSSTVFSNVPAGTLLPICVKQVKAGSTTCTLIVALW